MTTLLTGLTQDDSGQDLIEYALLAGVITVASVLAMIAVGGKVMGDFTNLQAAMP